MNVEANMQVTAAFRVLDECGECLRRSTPEQPLRYIHGRGELLSELERALEGAAVGDQKCVTLNPEEAFGPHRPELVFEAIREHLPPGELKEGMSFAPGGQQGKFTLRVIKLTEKGALLDGNHPLAGKTLTWEISIEKIRSALPEVSDSCDHEPLRWVSLNG
ncbi:FKBP-type peptidyl-prolyl cis-trans isomerase [Marinospirillum alkaliphilum]|uniref:peptidylprolyl isomerase n=1 Tax=Marinospirillum alkaliphilum DSM 21637 TaxID=1122209 RepID=A0A1K1ZKB3_9GAMM|nr:FKBP-type peptidyl-prolyl cis-trans isomerase [Marinospirillum alkaliphilum]SFX74690.1 FKBP-type peptidyl-prolyl cis-trans isomerase SlyD [Marinospirillum alkaliphilum DSM 21637]